MTMVMMMLHVAPKTRPHQMLVVEQSALHRRAVLIQKL
jgi:hypothetical protein